MGAAGENSWSRLFALTVSAQIVFVPRRGIGVTRRGE
jgi:hypothetical protein